VGYSLMIGRLMNHRLMCRLLMIHRLMFVGSYTRIQLRLGQLQRLKRDISFLSWFVNTPVILCTLYIIVI
jgi:hypothetical protein